MTKQMLLGATIVACLVVMAQADIVLNIENPGNPGTFKVERGTDITLAVQATGTGDHAPMEIGRFVATLNLGGSVVAMNVPGDPGILDGDVFSPGQYDTYRKAANPFAINPYKPYLYAWSTAAPWYESSATATLASFILEVSPTATVKNYTVSTVETTIDNPQWLPISSIVNDNKQIGVVVPEMSLTTVLIDFGDVPISSNLTLGTTATNIGDPVTVLDGSVGSIVPDTFNGAGGGFSPNPFSFVSGAEPFGLGGGPGPLPVSDPNGENGEYDAQEILVNFAPTYEGAFVAYFDITSDDGLGGDSPVPGNMTRVILQGTGVPEPATLMLLGAAAVATRMRRRRR